MLPAAATCLKQLNVSRANAEVLFHSAQDVHQVLAKFVKTLNTPVNSTVYNPVAGTVKIPVALLRLMRDWFEVL